MLCALAAVFLITDKIEGNYGARPSANLHIVTRHISRLFWGKKSQNANILAIQLIFSDWRYF